MTLANVHIFFLLKCFTASETIRLIRTTTDIKEFISDRNNEKVSFAQIKESSLENVRLTLSSEDFTSNTFSLMNLQYV